MKILSFNKQHLMPILIFVLGLSGIIVSAISMFAYIPDLMLLMFILSGIFFIYGIRFGYREKRDWETNSLYNTLISVLFWISIFCIAEHIAFCVLYSIQGEEWTNDFLQKLGIKFYYLVNSNALACFVAFWSSSYIRASLRKMRKNSVKTKYNEVGEKVDE